MTLTKFKRMAKETPIALELLWRYEATEFSPWLSGVRRIVAVRSYGFDLEILSTEGLNAPSQKTSRLGVERAAQFLGHPHILTQQVGHGKGIGHSTLGFPTVNLRVPEGVIVPAFGVYAARVWVLPDYPDHRPRIPGGGPYTAVTNVGVRPTVEDNDGRVTVEGFMLDFDGDLYGRQIRMEFHKRLRGERKFPSMAALAEEIRRNADQARDYFGG